MIRNLFQLFFLLISFQFFGQVYPVQITPIFNTPYSSRVSDYATSMDVKMQLLINPSDISITNRQVRLKMYLQGNNINAQSVDYVSGINPIYINGGELLTLTNLDIAALFRLENLQGISPAQYANALPEGMYNVCFEMYDYLTNQRISQKSCAYLYLMLNDPPLLNTPARNESIAVSEFTNILFTWTPRQLNATNVSYQFEIKEILDPTIDPQIGFLTSPTLYEETLYSTALLYDISKPNLIAGKRYAWRVRAMSTSGLSLNNVFKNEGYSEIFHFTYASHCPAPTFILSEALSARSVRISWLGDNSHTKYHIQYKKANVSGAEWFEVYTLNTQTTLSDLEAGVTYEFRVGGSCEPAVLGTTASFTYSGINQFSMPAAGTTNTTFTCGLNPAVAIANQTPITNLIVSETFTAGDFPVKILELTGNNPYTGKGYIIVPYLADTKIAVIFNNITVNTNYQLINGIVETSYNPDAPNISDLEDLLTDVFGPDPTSGSTENPTEGVLTGENTTGENTTGENTTGENTSDENTSDENTSDENTTDESPTVENTPVEVPNNENPNNENPADENSNTENSQYFIKYNDKNYTNGEKITIPFNTNTLTDIQFELVDLNNNDEVKYEIKYQSKLGNPVENVSLDDYLKTAQSKDKVIFDFSKDNTLKYKLKSTAQINGEPSILNDIELIVNPFKLNTFKAIDSINQKRFASIGQTLYYVTKTGVKSRKTNFVNTINPDLDDSEIPKQNIEWWLNNQLWRDGYGKRKYSKDIYNNKNVNVKCKAGYPTLFESEVKVKWVNGGISIDNLAFNFDKIDKVKGYLDKLRNFIGIPVFTSLQSYNNSKDPISMLFAVEYLNERENIESKENRLYYTKTKNQFTLNVGVKGEIEKPVPGLAIPEVEKELWGHEFKFALGLYWFIEANAKGEIGANKTYKKWVESSTAENSSWVFNEPSNLELKIILGLNPKVLCEIPGFKVEGSGKSSASAGILKVDMSGGFKVSCPVVDEGIVLSCTPVANIELGPLSYSHTFRKYEYNFKPW